MSYHGSSAASLGATSSPRPGSRMLQDDSAIILEAEQDQGRAPATGGWYPEESPLFSVAGSDSGFSTQYGASASSPPVPSGTEKNDYFVSPGGTDTEVEYRPATARVENSDAGVPSVARTDRSVSFEYR